MRVAAVVLAAGESRRLGEPKQLVRLGGENLLERAVRIAGEAECSPVIVVLGASAAAVQSESALGHATIVMNHDWEQGMGGSVRAGVEALCNVDGCVVMTCDMPAVTAAHLLALMETGEIAASQYGGRRGVPAYFPKESFSQLIALSGDTGAKELLRYGRCVALEDGELDIDTPSDLARIRKLFS
jgi:molybdenum cofactor cytidylyltransferase